MNHQIVKIYNTNDFERTTKGIKVAQFMRLKSSSSDSDKIIKNFEDLVISNSLCCSYCNTVFADKYQQRSHYKLDWHRFNLKQHLYGLKSVSEDIFKVIIDKNDLSTSDSEENIQSEDCISQQWNKNKKIKKKTVNRNLLEHKLDSSDNDCTQEHDVINKNDILLSIGTRHSKVFFENEEGNIFSIYRCLLHNKKEIPEVDNEIITQALQSGRTSLWTIVMVGGGHFAAAVFSDGKVIVHKTIHTYTIRAKQGFVQSSRDNRHSSSFLKSAGANIRRQNEYNLTQQIQKVLESWSSYIEKSSLILYRAVGPCNRTKLFGGKNAPLDKNDPRLRPLPFPTRKATFSEVKRVYDILSDMEVYGSANNFRDAFPISPRQPCRKKSLKGDLINDNDICIKSDDSSKPINSLVDKQCKSSRTQIDRAKPRKSPHRPLPDIVAKLAQSSSESEFEIQDYAYARIAKINIIEHKSEVNLKNCLDPFENTTPLLMKKKNSKRKQKF